MLPTSFVLIHFRSLSLMVLALISSAALAQNSPSTCENFLLAGSLSSVSDTLRVGDQAALRLLPLRTYLAQNGPLGASAVKQDLENYYAQIIPTSLRGPYSLLPNRLIRTHFANALADPNSKGQRATPPRRLSTNTSPLPGYYATDASNDKIFTLKGMILRPCYRVCSPS